MQHYEWGESQGDKREHSQIPMQISDEVCWQQYHKNDRKDFDCEDQRDLWIIVLQRKILVQFKAAFWICMFEQVNAENLFTDFEFQDVSLVNRHIPWVVKFKL